MAASKKSGKVVSKNTTASSKTREIPNDNKDTLAVTASSDLSYAMLLGCLVVAAISFGAGICTPILTNSSGRSDVTRSLATTTQPVACDEATLAQFLQDDEPAVGMHLLCVDSETNAMTVYRGLYEEMEEPIPLTVSWHDTKVRLQESLNLQTLDLRQPWAVFTSDGARKLVSADEEIEDGRDLLDEFNEAGMVLIMEGGNWLWPGVRVGFRRTIDVSAVPATGFIMQPRNATLETLSLKPLVLSVEGFLTEDECDFIQAKAMPQLRYSQVSLMDKDAGRPSSDFRTSQSTFVRSTEESMKQVDYRTASLVRIPRSHQEFVQVLRYGEGEHYSAHHDFFNPELYKNDPTTLKSIEQGRRNRLATVFWYLSDVAAGGETNFPLYNNARYPPSLDKCTQGLMVKPLRGKVVIFYSLLADGDMDPLSLHAACHVIDGVKYAANKWVWNAPVGHLPNL